MRNLKPSIVAAWSLASAISFGAEQLNADANDLKIRTGDRCITLRWTAPSRTATHLFRSEHPNGPYQEIPGSPFHATTAVDLNVENGRTYFYRITSKAGANRPASATVSATPNLFADNDGFLEFLQGTAFDYFWHETNPANGLIRDRNTARSPASIAAVGFGLTAIGIGIDHGWITRQEGAERTLRTLRFFWQAPQGSGPEAAGYKGWFYHFLDMQTGLRVWKCELSSIDTALLLAGILYSKEYFDGDTQAEREIRSIAAQLYERVDWKWMLNGGDTLTMGWHPETGFIKARWTGYNEASILYLLAIGAEGDSLLQPAHWKSWTRTYQWSTSYNLSFIHFPPLFGHQYSACWIDFRDIQDDYTRAKGITYFENSRRATLAQRAYAIENPKRFAGYSAENWGFTASDGPRGYSARGTPPPENDDGTISPTAPGGSVAFAPEECLAALRQMYQNHRTNILSPYGFKDAFNLSANWWATDVLGIDQGSILIMAENFRTGRVWQRMKRSEPLKRGLTRAGFQRIEK